MIQEIADAFNAADSTLAVEVSKGFGADNLPAGSDIENRIRNGSSVRVLLDVNPRPDMDLSVATRNIIESGFCMMFAYAKSPDAAFTALRSWWLTIAGDSTRLLSNIEGKTTLGTVEFLQWRAVGGFQGFAQRQGGVWYVDQLVEYAAWTPP